MTVVKAAAAQLSPVLYSRDGTVEKIVRKIAEVGRQDVQFATFPETVVPYYPYFSFVERPFEMAAEQLKLLDQAVTIPSPATHAIADAAGEARMVVSIGVNERDGGSRSQHANHSAMFPGSFGGPLFAEQTELSVRNHALESGRFVVNATAWLDADQHAQIMADTGAPIGPISGSFTAIVSPLGELLGEPLRSGEGEVIADLDFSLIDKRKAKMDASGHYSRPELLSLLVDRRETAHVHEQVETQASAIDAEVDRVRI